MTNVCSYHFVAPAEQVCDIQHKDFVTRDFVKSLRYKLSPPLPRLSPCESFENIGDGNSDLFQGGFSEQS